MRQQRELGVRRREAPARRPTSGWGALTATEARVVRLVGEGLTNREVAERLVVSPRTVETHVAHAYAKLGIASRVQLALLAARHTSES
jgi:DNA-binding CsgD family transcriptional regulator